MQNRFYQIAIAFLLLCMVFMSGAVLNGYRAQAAPKRTYKSDTTAPSLLQELLNQRAAEGWRFAGLSEGSQDNSAPYLVVVFEKE